MSFLFTKEWQEPVMKRILIPLQGFPGEVNAINLGFSLAECSNALVSILHCKERFGRSNEFWLDRLNEHAKLLSNKLGVSFETERVKRVRASDAILKSSTKGECDLVILSAAHTSTHKHLLGSTARRVTRKSKIPIIIVASWLEDFSKDQKPAIRKILLPIRKIAKDMAALRLAAALKKSSVMKSAEIIALNVSNLPSVTSLAAIDSDVFKHERELFLDDVEIFKEETEFEIKPQHIAAPKITEAALEIARKENVDLIILGAQRKPGRFGGILGSVSLGLATQSKIPVVITFEPKL